MELRFRFLLPSMPSTSRPVMEEVACLLFTVVGGQIISGRYSDGYSSGRVNGPRGPREVSYLSCGLLVHQAQFLDSLRYTIRPMTTF